jgi:hypothetical protein
MEAKVMGSECCSRECIQSFGHANFLCQLMLGWFIATTISLLAHWIE